MVAPEVTGLFRIFGASSENFYHDKVILNGCQCDRFFLDMKIEYEILGFFL